MDVLGIPRRIAIAIGTGWVAQLAEQWTENPRVAGSIPAPATLLLISGGYVTYTNKSHNEMAEKS